MEQDLILGGGVRTDERSSRRAPRRTGARTRPSRTQAEAAVRTLIEWAGEDPDREGLLETPARVARAYEELFAGYGQDPKELLAKTFSEVGGYDELVVLKDIAFVSCCEHHMLPIIGKAHVGYLPGRRVVGISKLVRVVHGFARRMQIQERMAVEIAKAIRDVLKPRGVGVIIQAEHSCMTLRGVNLHGSTMCCSALFGEIRDNPSTRSEFQRLAGLSQ
jgi:GTP cyclohydrolase I